MNKGELGLGEPHPAAYSAKEWFLTLTPKEWACWAETFASCALSGNRLSEICSETIDRLTTGRLVSDRYLLGLVWTMRFGRLTKEGIREKGAISNSKTK